MTHRQRDESASFSRRELLAYTTAFGSTFMAAQGLAAEISSEKEAAVAAPAKRYDMKK